MKVLFLQCSLFICQNFSKHKCSGIEAICVLCSYTLYINFVSQTDIDIDECTHNVDECEHICMNTEGSYAPAFQVTFLLMMENPVPVSDGIHHMSLGI